MFLAKEHQEMFTDTKNQHFYTENPFLSLLNRFIESVNSIYILSTLFLVLLIQKYTILMFFQVFYTKQVVRFVWCYLQQHENPLFDEMKCSNASKNFISLI